MIGLLPNAHSKDLNQTCQKVLHFLADSVGWKIEKTKVDWKLRLRPDQCCKTLYFEPLVSDHLSSDQCLKIPKFSSQITIFGISCKRPPLFRPVFQNTKSFQVKSLYLDSLVSDHLSSDQCFKIPKVFKSNRYIWTLL